MRDGLKDLPQPCPVCGARQYRPVIVPRPKGGLYQTQFFECVGCSTMFRDPVKFRKSADVVPLRR